MWGGFCWLTWCRAARLLSAEWSQFFHVLRQQKRWNPQLWESSNESEPFQQWSQAVWAVVAAVADPDRVVPASGRDGLGVGGAGAAHALPAGPAVMLGHGWGEGFGALMALADALVWDPVVGSGHVLHEAWREECVCLDLVKIQLWDETNKIFEQRLDLLLSKEGDFIFSHRWDPSRTRTFSFLQEESAKRLHCLVCSNQHLGTNKAKRGHGLRTLLLSWPFPYV